MAHAFEFSSGRHEICRHGRTKTLFEKYGHEKWPLSFPRKKKIVGAQTRKRVFAQATQITKQTVQLINLYLFTHFRTPRDTFAPPLANVKSDLP